MYKRQGRKQIVSAPVAHDLSVPLHRKHATFEERHFSFLDIQGDDQIGERHRNAMLSERLDDELPAWQGKVILLTLPFKERVTATQFAEFLGVLSFRY